MLSTQRILDTYWILVKSLRKHYEQTTKKKKVKTSIWICISRRKEKGNVWYIINLSFPAYCLFLTNWIDYICSNRMSPVCACAMWTLSVVVSTYTVSFRLCTELEQLSSGVEPFYLTYQAKKICLCPTNPHHRHLPVQYTENKRLFLCWQVHNWKTTSQIELYNCLLHSHYFWKREYLCCLFHFAQQIFIVVIVILRWH